MKLLIIESPGKQATIKKYLGADWNVVASLGHIRGLEHNLNFLQRDFEPKYEWIAEKAKAIKQVKDAAKQADDIYLAADKDFEGEQIAYSVCLLLKLNPATAKRITFTEITQKAILSAIEHPGRIDMDRVHTQQCRALLDLLIGFTMSPLLWKHVAPSLSAGRCQTPAVRLVVEREKAIESFTSESSWRISGEWQHPNGLTFPAIMTDELTDEESASNYLENIHATTEATVQQTTVKPWTDRAPEPLITSTLQQQASALYHSNPKNTMRIAQRLYEAGHITYMRTDKAVLSEEARISAQDWVREAYGDIYVSPHVKESDKKKKGKKDEEVKAQEAHEAIRPTHMEYTELEGDDWTPLDKKMYHLIWQRTIQSVMTAVRGESCTIVFQLKDDEFTWEAHEKHIVFDGWRRVGSIAAIEENDQEEEEKDAGEGRWDQFTSIKVGDIMTWKGIRADSVETKAKGRYNEATLVKDLETYGIGRPSTFASLLAVIQEKGYVEAKDIPSKEVDVKEYKMAPGQWPPIITAKKKKVGGEKNKLVPTELGRSMLHFMLQHFEDLFAFTFTATMEKRLDAIAEGKEEWRQVMRDMWDSYKDRYTALSNSASEEKAESSERRREWGGGLISILTKKGPLLLIEGRTKDETVFLGWPKGISFQEITLDQVLTFKAQVEKEKQGHEMGTWNEMPILKKTGKFGTYLQCGDHTIPFQEGETAEQTVQRFEKKLGQGSGVLKTFKEYVVRTGPYGPYLMKTTLKKAKFVSLPKGVNIETMTEKEAEQWYKLGLDRRSAALNTNNELKKTNKSRKDT